MPKYKHLPYLQRAFVEIVDERATELGYSRRAFAAKVWPDMKIKSANHRWSAMRTKSFVTFKPQSVLIEDAFYMAEALGESALYLLGKAVERAMDMARNDNGDEG